MFSRKTFFIHRLPRLALPFGLLAVLALPFPTQADYLDSWSWRLPTPQGNTLNDLTYAGNLWVGVADHGMVVTSSDGLNWSGRWTSVTDNLRGIAYGGGLYVAVGSNGRIVYSSDGVTWASTSTGAGSSDELAQVVYGNGKFVAVSAYGNQTYYTSSNGRNWTASSATLPYITRDARYCNGKFQLAGMDSSGYSGIVASSTDGTTWTSQSVLANTILNGLACNGSTLVAVSSKGSSRSSDGGNTWTTGSGGVGFNHVTVGSNYVASTDSGAVYTSSDGLNWSKVATPTDGALKRLANNGGSVVAVGAGGRIAASINGAGWQMAASGSSGRYLDHVAYGNGSFVVAGTGNNPALGNANTLLSSANGNSWVSRGSGVFYGLGFVNDRFIAVGHDGTILTSTDGSTWKDVSLPGIGSLYGVAYGNCRYVITGTTNNGVALVSYNGKNWKAVTVSDSQLAPFGFYRVAFGNGIFVTVGNGYDSNWHPIVFTSTDGETWAKRNPPSGAMSLQNIAFGNGLFVAGGGGIYVSTDGNTWSQVSTASVGSITYSQNTFFTAGNYDGKLYTSTDGYSWQAKNTPAGAIGGVAYGNGTVVVGGQDDVVLQSDAVSSCYTITPSTANIAAAGGNTSVQLSNGTSNSCTWRATLSNAWLSINAPTNGTNNPATSATLSVTAEANACFGTRQGDIWVDGRSVTIKQVASDADRVYNWAEDLLPSFFKPGGQPSQTGSGYYYRYYPQSNTAVGASNNAAYYYDGIQVLKLDTDIPGFLQQAAAAGY